MAVQEPRPIAPNGTGNWTGSISILRTANYLIQAVDWGGNVSLVMASGNDVDSSGRPLGSTFNLPRVFSVVLADTDGDTIPDAYETQYPCLNSLPSDANADTDYDYLTNITEYGSGTNPCKADSDGGGDNDGSENSHGRSTSSPADDRLLTINVTRAGSDYTVSWPVGLGQNSTIDGYYHVYRSTTPFFAPGAINPFPIPNGTTSYLDTPPICPPTCPSPSIYYYRVWNVALSTPPPTVAVVVPNSGPAGTAVTVYGANFVSGASVKFGTVAATAVTFVNASQINCTTPAGPPSGACTVTVTNPNGQDGTLASAYTYP